MTDDDSGLTVEMSFTTWRASCKDPHIRPNGELRQCRRPQGHQGAHASGFGFGRVRWS